MLPWSEKITGIFMENELYLNKVLNFQNEFFKRLKVVNHIDNKKLPDLFNELIRCDEEVVKLGLGDIGLKLKNFISQVDLTHPEISNVFDGLLANDQAFSKSCRELLALACHARHDNLVFVAPYLNQFLYKEYNSLIKKIDTPYINRINVRFLKDVEEREQIRCSKKMQIIDLQGIYKKGKSFWDSQPSNFSRFLRFDTSYKDELKNAEKKAKRYEELGCTSLAEEVNKTIELFREHAECNYFGFNRITMTKASIVLAKSLGFSYIENYNQDNIVINKKIFYNFNPEFGIENNPYLSIATGKLSVPDVLQDSYNYEPRVYPYHEFIDIASDETKSIIFHLENFPEVDNKPIFDHFAVIVPGVEFPLRNSQSFSFLNKSGILNEFKTREEALKNLDLNLIKNKDICPIIIGEKDGKCYFISYFQSIN
jgi:hypothetical protein